MLKIFSVAICAASLATASDSAPITITQLFATSPEYKVTHGKNGFTVYDKTGTGRTVSPVDVSTDLRNVTSQNLVKQLSQNGTRLQVTRRGNDFEITKQQTLNGGGAGGAWLGSWLGYGSVMVTSKIITGLIVWPIAVACPPAGIVVAGVLETVVPVVVQPIAVTAALAGGIAGGAATGPI